MRCRRQEASRDIAGHAMTRDDQGILATVVDLLHRADPRDDADYALFIRRHLRAALSMVVALDTASRRATRRGAELRRRDEAAARIYRGNVQRLAGTHVEEQCSSQDGED
jgi:hypothetical protein